MAPHIATQNGISSHFASPCDHLSHLLLRNRKKETPDLVPLDADDPHTMNQDRVGERGRNCGEALHRRPGKSANVHKSQGKRPRRKGRGHHGADGAKKVGESGKNARNALKASWRRSGKPRRRRRGAAKAYSSWPDSAPEPSADEEPDPSADDEPASEEAPSLVDDEEASSTGAAISLTESKAGREEEAAWEGTVVIRPARTAKDKTAARRRRAALANMKTGRRFGPFVSLSSSSQRKPKSPSFPTMPSFRSLKGSACASRVGILPHDRSRPAQKRLTRRRKEGIHQRIGAFTPLRG